MNKPGCSLRISLRRSEPLWRMAFWEMTVTGTATLPSLRSLRVAVTTASSSSLAARLSAGLFTWAIEVRQYNAITAVSVYRWCTIIGVLALSNVVNGIYAIALQQPAQICALKAAYALYNPEIGLRERETS